MLEFLQSRKSAKREMDSDIRSLKIYVPIQTILLLASPRTSGQRINDPSLADVFSQPCSPLTSSYCIPDENINILNDFSPTTYVNTIGNSFPCLSARSEQVTLSLT